jgi:hypothetical protein
MKKTATVESQLPGYHGKGLYSGQGRVIYANNGEHSKAAQADPATPSGALAEWRGGGDWQLVWRNQFTEVTGPGGLFGNAQPERDQIWSVGWDVRSLLLMVLDGGQWHTYRLPKTSHCYDGAHGWNTEWPRIRDVGESDLLMTMHGLFWRFPKTFSAMQTAGIAPRSSHLKVIGDFCRWDDCLVFGCDDTANSEFLNRRKAKGKLAAPGKSQSNLWFVEPAHLDALGPALGRGAVWLDDSIKVGRPSDPFLFAGFQQRVLHLTHAAATPVTFKIEVDVQGRGAWQTLRSVEVPAHGYAWTEFAAAETGVWVRVQASRDCSKATAFFHYRNADLRGTNPGELFDGLACPGDQAVNGGLLYARGANFRTLRYIARNAAGELGCYDMDAALKLRRADDPAGVAWMWENVAIPERVLSVDAASVLYVDERNRRWRLPKNNPAFDQPGALGVERICREVCTERDLFNVHGTFYELPAENADGFAKIRPIATHNRRIKDYAAYRGLLVLSGVATDAPANPHIVRSADGACTLWVGVVDDLWQLGKPVGHGGPWLNTLVAAGTPSDPYLMTGYDRKSVTFSHNVAETVAFTLEVDFTGTGHWFPYAIFRVPPGQTITHQFPAAYGAYWVRVVSDRACLASAQFSYE